MKKRFLLSVLLGAFALSGVAQDDMYYVPSNVQYERIEWVVDDELVPKEFLSYYDINYYEFIRAKNDE